MSNKIEMTIDGQPHIAIPTIEYNTLTSKKKPSKVKESSNVKVPMCGMLL